MKVILRYFFVQWKSLKWLSYNKDKNIFVVQPKMAAPNKPLKFDKICRACLEIKKDMRPLFEQLTATMLMGISKVQVRWQIDKIFWESIFVSLTLTAYAICVCGRQTSFTSRHLCLEVIRYEQFRIPEVLREFTKFCWEMSYVLFLAYA